MTTSDIMDQEEEDGNYEQTSSNQISTTINTNTNNDNDDKTDQVIGHMRDEALRRKERLKQLRMKNASQKSIIHLQNDDGELPKPIFRNYKPQSEELKDGELPAGKPVDLNKHIISQLEAADAPVIVDEVNLMSLAPRKPDWI
ncbi:unnamed protein product [Heterobilharzia americana]|nr:unnamed protein product [Heterobilharzia americana]